MMTTGTEKKKEVRLVACLPYFAFSTEGGSPRLLT